MYLTPDAERQSRLRLEGFELGWLIIWCPRCDFQMPPQSAGPSHCPDCGRGLHLTTVTEELQQLVADRKKAGEVRVTYPTSTFDDPEVNARLNAALERSMKKL